MNLDFCPNKKSKEFQEMSGIFGEDKAYFLWMRNKGNHLEKAPNGADSKLFRDLLEYFKGNRAEALKAKAKVYTNDFINWFGKWTEDNKENVSKVVDKNGEPLVVYHGSNEYGFEEFDPSKADDKISIFATDSKFIASTYTNFQPIYSSLIKGRLNNRDFIEAIKNKDWDTAKRIVKSIYDRNVSREEQIYMSGSYGTYTYLSSTEGMQLPEDERNALLDSAASDEEAVKHHFSLNVKTSHNGKVTLTLEDDNDEGGRFINTAILFVGSPEQLLESIQKDTKIYSLFLNIKNPLILDKQVGEYGAINNWNRLDFSVASTEVDDTTIWGEKTGRKKRITRTRDVAKYAKENGYDGVLFGEIIDHGGYEGDIKLNPITDADVAYEYFHEGEDSYTGGNVYSSQVFIAFNPNQLKDAVKNNGMFSTTDNNIYHNESDNVAEFEKESLAYHKWLAKAQDKLSNLKRNMPEQERERIKNEIREDFARMGFKHFELGNIMYSDKTNKWYIQTVRSVDRRDTQDLCRIAKQIGVKNKDFHTIDGDQIETLFEYLFAQNSGTSEHINNIIKLLAAIFKNKTINIKFADDWYNESPAYYDHEHNMIVMNINGVYKNSNNHSNIVAQTLLHELLHSVTVETVKRSPELRNELQHLLDKVRNSAEVKQLMAQGQYGLTDIYEFLAELSNEEFVRILQNIHTGTEGKSLLNNVVDFLKKVANQILSFVNAKHRGTAYADAMELLVKASLPQEFNINTTAKPQDEQTIFRAISSRQQAAQDEAQRIITRMNVLHKQYERIKSKTPSQQKIANKIFETLNELKQHRDISAIKIALKQAMLSLGQYDPTTNGPAAGTSNDVYKYLFSKSQTGFQGVDAKQLVDMYRNTIKFYQDLINGIPSKYVIDLTDEDQNDIANLTDLIEQHIMPLWIQAIMKVGDDIVDEQIDSEVEASDQDKEDMKQVAKDWLHKNLMYGDVSGIESYLYNASYSQDPIIKQAFHLIQHAEQQTLEEMHHIAPKLMKAYQKANKGLKSFTPGWQSMMMEFDKDGKPTGNFVRDLNYGQYQKDLKGFIDTLNSDFIKKYKYTYITDETGAVVNSLTGEFAEDEEWGPNGEMPKYVEYQLAIEQFKAPRIHRRFTPKYYTERLSRPYDGTIDPMSSEFKDTKFNHGLSPKTLSRYNYYQSNINYYLDKCQDEKTGVVYPERLSPDDKFSLDQWKSRLEDFTSIFNKDGSYKHGEDLKMAYEVRAWQKWIGQNTNSKHLQDQLNIELNEAYQRSIAEHNPRIYHDFIKYNTSTGINPDYIEQTVGSFASMAEDTDFSFRGKILRKALQDMVKSQNYSRELQKMENNPLFWLQCKASDQSIESARQPNQSGWDPAKVKVFKESFYDREILYVDSRGFYIDENGNAVDPNSQNAKILEDSGKLLTYRQYLINKYTNEAFTTGMVNGLIDESTGLPIDFSGMTVNDIRQQIITLLSYKYRVFDEDGNVESEEYRPLSIFTMLTPTKDTFFNKRTGKTEKTITFIGEGRFKESNSTFSTPLNEFNPNEGISEKPNKDFDNGRYDNSETFNKLTGDVKELYDQLIKTMEEMQNIYSTNRKFNYKLPQINANDAALFSRLIKRGYTDKSLRAIWDSMNQIMPNDNRLRTKEDYFIGVDGEIANDVPLKLIRNLDNPEDISTDLVNSVIMFADMAINYKNKSAIDATLKLLRYNMDPDNRKFYEDKLMPKSERPSNNNAGSRKMYDSMMDVLMYGNKYGDAKNGGPSKAKIAFHKTADAFQSLESSAMLGLNMFSMSVGFADSITRIFAESAAGKYMTVGDTLFALGTCLRYTPACIKNMFNPLANNKLTALMQMNGVSKGIFGIYNKTDWGKGRKLFGNLLMGGWSMLDWMANALLMTAFYHNSRFYDGGIVPTGFYTKYELQQAFINAGHTKAEANHIHHNWSNIGRRVTLWDAYYFEDGEAIVRPEFEQYVTQKIKTRLATKTKKRGALYNGMNPDNDIPRWKRDVIGRLAGALRGWIVQQWQHLVAGGTDNIVRTFGQKLKYETTTSGTKAKPVWEKDKLTDEQKSRRFSWDYESGTPQDQIIVGLYRSLKTAYKEISQWCKLKPSTAKFSEVEKYAMKDALIFVAMLSMMMVGWTYIHDDARTVKAPTNREEAGPATWWNPVDYYDYMRDVYIPNQYWKLAVDDIYFRTVESKISNVNPQQVLDIVSALTALKSGLDDQLGVFGIVSDAISGDADSDEVLKQGAYKFYTKGDRTFYRAIGPAKNLHTALTYYGATNNLRWYTNKFGKLYRAFGYDFKTKDKQSQIGNSEFTGGDFSGGDFSGGDFTGGDFK